MIKYIKYYRCIRAQLISLFALVISSILLYKCGENLIALPLVET